MTSISLRVIVAVTRRRRIKVLCFVGSCGHPHSNIKTDRYLIPGTSPYHKVAWVAGLLCSAEGRQKKVQSEALDTIVQKPATVWGCGELLVRLFLPP